MIIFEVRLLDISQKATYISFSLHCLETSSNYGSETLGDMVELNIHTNPSVKLCIFPHATVSRKDIAITQISSVCWRGESTCCQGQVFSNRA